MPISPRLLVALRDYWRQTRPSDYLFPGKTDDIPLEQGSGSEGLHSGCCPAQDPQACDATHHATLLRDRTPGSRSRLDGHQPTAGAQQLYNDHDLSTHRRQHLDSSPSPIDWLPVRQCPKWIDPTLRNSDQGQSQDNNPGRNSPNVYGILQRHVDDCMKKYGDRVPVHVESTLVRMHHCRTAALGGHTYRCDACNYETKLYNSCGDRHCPQCSGAKRRTWLDSTLELIVPRRPTSKSCLLFRINSRRWLWAIEVKSTSFYSSRPGKRFAARSRRNLASKRRPSPYFILGTSTWAIIRMFT